MGNYMLYSSCNNNFVFISTGGRTVRLAPSPKWLILDIKPFNIGGFVTISAEKSTHLQMVGENERMEKIKIITLCGSLKYIEKMWEIAEKLSLERGYAVIGVNPHVIGRPLTDDEISTMKRLHKEKIAISDGIFVVNVNGYIGDSVKEEIAFAKSLNKEIFYLENPQLEDKKKSL